MSDKVLLVCAPHTDDAELGCGGSMARFLEEGWSVHVAAFSNAEASLPAGSAPDRLELGKSARLDAACRHPALVSSVIVIITANPPVKAQRNLRQVFLLVNSIPCLLVCKSAMDCRSRPSQSYGSAP